MSFGDNTAAVPRMFTSAAGTFDSVLGPAFTGKKPTGAGQAPQMSTSIPQTLVTKPESQDTPGRHKTLLGR